MSPDEATPPDPLEPMKVLARYPAQLRWQMEAAVLTTRSEGGPSSINVFQIAAAEHYLGVLARRFNDGEPFDIELGRQSVGRRRGRS
jgi:hypothetical protein